MDFAQFMHGGPAEIVACAPLQVGVFIVHYQVLPDSFP
jgi:hypothetical protein